MSFTPQACLFASQPRATSAAAGSESPDTAAMRTGERSESVRTEAHARDSGRRGSAIRQKSGSLSPVAIRGVRRVARPPNQTWCPGPRQDPAGSCSWSRRCRVAASACTTAASPARRRMEQGMGMSSARSALRTWRMQRVESIDANPRTFEQRSAAFAAAVPDGGTVTLLVSRTERDGVVSQLSAPPRFGESGALALAQAVGAKAVDQPAVRQRHHAPGRQPVGADRRRHPATRGRRDRLVRTRPGRAGRAFGTGGREPLGGGAPAGRVAPAGAVGGGGAAHSEQQRAEAVAALAGAPARHRQPGASLACREATGRLHPCWRY